MPCARSWFTRNEKIIVGFGAIATVMSVPVSVLMFFLAYIQLSETKKAIQANNMYEISKDARDIWDDISEDAEVYSYIFSDNAEDKISDETKRKADVMVKKAIRFYASLNRQNRVGMLDQDFWNAANKDFCAALKMPVFNKVWSQIKRSDQWDRSFVALGDQCR